MRFLLTVGLLFAALTATVVACKGGSGGGTPLCDPGENIFCRCPGGAAGTKTCNAQGDGFDPCVTREGACATIDPWTSSSSSSSSSSSGSTGGTGGTTTTTTTTDTGTGTGGGGPGALYDPCANDADCQSSLCKNGYCTKDCAKYDECTLGTGECVLLEGQQICLRDCSQSADCLSAFGSPSACGYTTAVDGTPVATCADWLSTLKIPPEGTSCTDDSGCNLGNAGLQAVCSGFGQCIKGCYQQSDCPGTTTCSSNGSVPGTCK